jgi:hypothetical protein
MSETKRVVAQMVTAGTDLFVLDNLGRIWALNEDEEDRVTWDLLPELPQDVSELEEPPKYTGIASS